MPALAYHGAGTPSPGQGLGEELCWTLQNLQMPVPRSCQGKAWQFGTAGKELGSKATIPTPQGTDWQGPLRGGKRSPCTVLFPCLCPFQELPSEALLDPSRPRGRLTAPVTHSSCHPLTASSACQSGRAISGLQRGEKGQKKPFFQRARCYQTDTLWPLFISQRHTGTPSPQQHPGASGRSCNNPNFHGALLYICSSCAPRAGPKPVPKGTVSTPKGHCPTRSQPESPVPGEIQSISGKSSLWRLFWLPALPVLPSAMRKEALQLGQELFPPSIH